MSDDNNFEISPELIASKVKNSLKQDIVKELLKRSFRDSQTTLSNDALTLVTEVAKCLVIETCLRAADIAICESSNGQVCSVIDYKILQKCLPQLMLDFP